MMNFFKKLKWLKKQIRWNYKYKKGKWDYMGKENLRYQAIVNQIRETKLNQPKILDLGCGYGALNDYLSADDYSRFLGVDFSSNAIQRANNANYPNATFQVEDIHQFFPNETFDIIIFNEVLYYLEDQMEIVNRFSTYFNAKGFFIFSFYGGREDLVHELEENFQLIHKESVQQSESVHWNVCLYQAR